ncbi:hypothetical protein AUC71_15460 [Methyloceanibacter marginalis]|uniref:FecR protein domain-containing protein n=1 Tax=Methyloceanibacter marginalis TaxID=1774971 RepID=A0A1E3W9C4_9HYPH|nr:FecR domain-containing protein [Methyloceanibacter marginalis]ODS02425.1 hypothetical protein AUC71_15460 [Methyloceanibacter marginalis]
MRDTRTPAFLLGLSVALMLAAGPAQAEKVGVAAAVNPDAFSSLSGTPNKQLNIGKSIFYNERINTTDSGLVQVLLVDGSTFTVGPNSNLVIDRFVYDPRKKTGELVATFSKGTMRFIGGKLSKNEGGVTVNTPSGALAIRGGMFQASLSGNRGIFSFLFGNYMQLGGKRVYETGYTIDTTSGTPTIRPTTRQDINLILAALTNSNWRSGTNNTASNTQNQGPNFFQNDGEPDELIDTATQDQIQAELQKEFQNRLKNLPSAPNDTNSPDTSNPNPPGPAPDTRVGGEFRGYASGFIVTDGAPQFVGSLAPDSSLTLTPSTNTVSGIIDVREMDPTSLLALLVDSYSGTKYNIGYGSTGSENYQSDQNFGASAQTAAVTETWTELVWEGWFPRLVNRSATTNPAVTGSLASGQFVEGNPLPNGLCDDCDFIHFGTWGAKLTSQNESSTALGGWWIASDITDAADLPTEGNATYAGSAIGYASNKPRGGAWSTPYIAKGDMNMNWNFGTRKGDLSITGFDGRNFGGNLCGGGVLCPTGKNHFVGGLAFEGQNRVRGAAAGSFVNNGPNKAVGVIGNFGIGDNRWKGTGVFGGAAVPR